MGKKTKFPFLFKATETTATATTSAAPSWPWPSCATDPKTLSFRASNNDNTYKTLNSTIFDGTPDSLSNICNHFERENLLENYFSGKKQPDTDESAVVRGLRSDRLFFEPGETSSILEEAKTHDFPYRDSASILAMDSIDPFLDFRVSMEEMVEAHGLKDWECLEELLACYLRINGRSNHGYIIGAFVDLLLRLTFSSDDSSNPAIDEPCSSCSSSSNATLGSFTSPFSFSSSSCSSISPCLSSLAWKMEMESVWRKMVAARLLQLHMMLTFLVFDYVRLQV